MNTSSLRFTLSILVLLLAACNAGTGEDPPPAEPAAVDPNEAETRTFTVDTQVVRLPDE